MTTKIPPELVDDQVFGRRNILINGDFGIYQRALQVTGLGASENYFTADRWVLNGNLTSGRLTMTAATADAPTESNVYTSLKLDCTTADTSLGVGEVLTLQQRVEGYNLQHVKKGTSGAKELTASFWVKGNASATYVLELYDADNTRQVSKSFSVTSSWSKVELTFPTDTTGTFDNDSSTSLFFQIWLASGTTFTSGTLNETWNSVTNANRAVGVSNFFSSTSNELYITAVQLEVGSQATPFEHRSIGEELALCQRYYVELTSDQQVNPIMNCGYYNTTAIYGAIIFPTEMRTEPTLEQTTGTDYFRVYSTGAADTFTGFNSIHSVTPQRVVIAAVSAQGISGTQSAAGWCETMNTAARLSFTAEL